MLYDATTAIELANQFFLHGVGRIDTHAIISSFAMHKYPKKRARAARYAFIDRAMRYYNTEIMICPSAFGRLKGQNYQWDDFLKGEK